jgi:hypothetical protein
VWSRLAPGLRHYPNDWLAKSPVSIFTHAWDDETPDALPAVFAPPPVHEAKQAAK